MQRAHTMVLVKKAAPIESEHEFEKLVKGVDGDFFEFIGKSAPAPMPANLFDEYNKLRTCCGSLFYQLIQAIKSKVISPFLSAI